MEGLDSPPSPLGHRPSARTLQPFEPVGDARLRRRLRPLAVGVLAGEVAFFFLAPFGEDYWAHYLAAKILTGRLSVDEALQVWPYPFGYDHLAFEALLTLPLSFLPPLPALLGWTALAAALLALTAHLLSRVSADRRIGSGEAILFSLAWPVTLVALYRGQISPVVALGLAGGLALAARGRPVPAGLATSLVLAKPHLWVGVAAGVLARKRWALLAGLGIGSGVLLLVSVPGIAAGLTLPNPEQLVTRWVFSNPLSVSLVGRFHFLPWPVQAAASFLGLAAVGLWWWRRGEESEAAGGLAWVGYLVFTPQLRVYDLVVLLPVILIALPWQSRWAQAGLILVSIGAIGSLRFWGLDLVAAGLVLIAIALWLDLNTDTAADG